MAEGKGAPVAPQDPASEEEFRGQVASGFGETVDKMEGITTELKLKELKEYAEQIDGEISELEEVQNQVCTQEHGADWKSNPDIAPLLGSAESAAE